MDHSKNDRTEYIVYCIWSRPLLHTLVNAKRIATSYNVLLYSFSDGFGCFDRNAIRPKTFSIEIQLHYLIK
jgi:hypothetical protein